jgi:hypothetical protein
VPPRRAPTADGAPVYLGRNGHGDVVFGADEAGSIAGTRASAVEEKTDVKPPKRNANLSTVAALESEWQGATGMVLPTYSMGIWDTHTDSGVVSQLGWQMADGTFYADPDAQVQFFKEGDNGGYPLVKLSTIPSSTSAFPVAAVACNAMCVQQITGFFQAGWGLLQGLFGGGGGGAEPVIEGAGA